MLKYSLLIYNLARILNLYCKVILLQGIKFEKYISIAPNESIIQNELKKLIGIVLLKE
jgi:hypothetical protein